MKPENNLPENETEELSSDGSASIEEFIKELEKKEKDLHISSDLVVEIEDSDEPEEPDAPELLKFLDTRKEAEPSSGSREKSIDTLSYQKDVSRLENEVDRLRRQISKFETDRLEVAEAARRRKYDFDNYRKRTERERGETHRNLLSKIATEVLPVLDNLSRALEAASGLAGEKSKDFQQFIDGVGLVNQQLNEVLEEMGIQHIISVGERFDPNFHEAVAAEQNDSFPPHTIIAEILRGYRIDNKIIRHSLVKVSTASPLPQAATAEVETE
ncbi:MAG: nucleotide exchange factor GrpE [Pyrinomonadaceae bacterium]